MTQANDVVERPSHYTMGGIEVIDAIEAWALNFHRGNAVKYIARAGRKDTSKEVEDLRKARWYIDREICRLTGVETFGLTGVEVIGFKKTTPSTEVETPPSAIMVLEFVADSAGAGVRFRIDVPWIPSIQRHIWHAVYSQDVGRTWHGLTFQGGL